MISGCLLEDLELKESESVVTYLSLIESGGLVPNIELMGNKVQWQI